MPRYFVRAIVAMISLSQINSLAAAEDLKKADAATAITSTANMQAASELADILVDQTRSNAMATTLINAATDEMIKKNQDVAALNEAFPGLDGAFRAALAAPMKNEVARILPLYRKEIAQFYAGRLSEADIRATTDFFRSPVGAALLMSLQQSAGMSNAATQIVSDKAVTSEALKQDSAIAGVRALFSLSPEQRNEIATFFNAPIGKRLSALNQERAAIDLKWFNYVSPEGEAEVGAAVMQAIVSHVAKTDPEAAEAIRAAMEKEMKTAK